jgi:CheY-like chemotaxis protein
MSDETKMRVLLIDDDDTFAEHFLFYAELSGWRAARLDGQSLEQLADILKDSKPNIILLDLSFTGGLTYLDWLRALEGLGCINQVLITTGDTNFTQEKYQIIGCNVLGVILKPIELSVLSNYIVRSNSNSNLNLNFAPSVQDIANFVGQLPAAISIHHILPDLCYTSPVWRNSAYEQTPIEGVAEQRCLRLMVHDLQENPEKLYSHREDWDVVQHKWLYSRLNRLNNAHYWFAREHRESAPNFFHSAVSLKDFLDEVAVLLRRWGITRMRYYNAYELYDDEIRGCLVVPFYQKGEGFEKGASEKDWLASVFFTQDGDAESVFSLGESEWYKRSYKQDTNVSGQVCREVGWGRIGTTKVEIPIFTDIDKPVGLLAFDRRYDHIGCGNIGVKADYSWLKVYDVAGTSGLNEITGEELDLMRGFIEQVAEELTVRRQAIRANQFRFLAETISEGIKDVLKESARTPKEVIKDFLSFLICRWDAIDNEPSNIEEVERGEAGVANCSILNWYFLRQESSGELRGLGGYGSIAEHREEHLFHNVEPFANAFNSAKANDNDGEVKGKYIIQDFSAWLTIHGKSLYDRGWIKENPNLKEDIEKIGAWIGIPIQVIDQHYLMVVHAKEKNYFTTRRTKLLKAVALRLSPFLLWLVAEESRAWFYRSLSHELKSPLDAALQFSNLSKFSDENELPNYLRYIHSLIANMWHLHHPETLKQISSPTSFLKDMWNIVPMIKTLHPLEEIEISPAFEDVPLAVPDEVLRQVLFNLLNNAFKFADKAVTAKIKIKVNQIDQNIVCKISNPIRESQKMSDQQRVSIFNQGHRAPNSGVASGSGIGLAVVQSLCKQTGMRCEALPADYINSVLYQTFCLTIPMGQP